MALIIKDRVQETSTTSGTGTLTLAGAVTGYQSFGSAIGNGNTTYYGIYANGYADWEVGIGTVTVTGGTTTLARTTVLASSNAGSLVNFSGAQLSVWGDMPAAKGAYFDLNGNLTTNCLFEGFTSQAASGTTITLTASSVQNWTITGSGGQTIQLPDATTLPNGALFTFNNNQSSGTIVVKNNSGTTVCTTQSGAYISVILLSNSIAAGSWDYHNVAPSNASWSTNTLSWAGSYTNGTWNGNVITGAYGGTGINNGTNTLTLSGSYTLNQSVASGAAPSFVGTNFSSIPNGALTNSSITINGNVTALGGSVSVGTVTSVSGTAPVVSSGGSTPTISMAAANTTTNGYLTSTDWNTFNNKQPAGSYLTSVTADAPLSGSGTSGSHLVISQSSATTNGYLSSTDWNTFNNKQPAGSYLTAVTASSPLSGSGTSGSPLVISQATTSTNGYLSSTDWNTFNNKQAAFGSQTANTFFAAPNGSSGTPSFRAIVAADVPTLNQNTTGTAANITATSNSTLTTLSALSLPGSQVSGNISGNAANVTGTVAIGNGGTGQITASAAFNALSPITTTGDLILGNGSNSATRLAIGANTYVLTSNGTTASWQPASGGGATITGTTTTGTYYIVGTTSTSGSLSTASISNTNTVAYNANTGVLQTSGGFQANSTGPFFLSATTVSANYTIPSSYNAVTAGKVTINTGVTVTVSTGSRWVVV